MISRLKNLDRIFYRENRDGKLSVGMWPCHRSKLKITVRLTVKWCSCFGCVQRSVIKSPVLILQGDKESPWKGRMSIKVSVPTKQKVLLVVSFDFLPLSIRKYPDELQLARNSP